MDKFQFVTISHPDQIKNKQRQSIIRKHAIRTSLKKNRNDAEKRRENFVEVEVNLEGGMVKRKPRTARVTIEESQIERTISAAKADPFDTMPGSPDRLRILMGHKAARQAGEPVFCVGDSGQIFFQGMDRVSKGALTDPALFHALSLVLALAANKNIPNFECLKQRGATLRNVALRMGDSKLVPKESTLTAMLLLIGYEYRVDGSASESIAMHIKAVDEVIKMSRDNNVEFSDTVRRALFWQDLYSCFFVDSTRLLSHEDHPEFCWFRDLDRVQNYVVPPAFISFVSGLPLGFSVLLEDLNALCNLVDSSCEPGSSPIDKLPVDNGQAWIESRLVYLLHDSRQSTGKDPLYQACIFALFLCTYKLFTGIWKGCFIPEFCASQVIGLVARVITTPSSFVYDPEVVLWLLFVSGALADRSRTKWKASVFILRLFRDRGDTPRQDWKEVKSALKSFIWCDHSMNHKCLKFWTELHPGLEVIE